MIEQRHPAYQGGAANEWNWLCAIADGLLRCFIWLQPIDAFLLCLLDCDSVEIPIPSKNRHLSTQYVCSGFEFGMVVVVVVAVREDDYSYVRVVSLRHPVLKVGSSLAVVVVSLCSTLLSVRFILRWLCASGMNQSIWLFVGDGVVYNWRDQSEQLCENRCWIRWISLISIY